VKWYVALSTTSSRSEIRFISLAPSTPRHSVGDVALRCPFLFALIGWKHDCLLVVEALDTDNVPRICGLFELRARESSGWSVLDACEAQVHHWISSARNQFANCVWVFGLTTNLNKSELNPNVIILKLPLFPNSSACIAHDLIIGHEHP